MEEQQYMSVGQRFQTVPADQFREHLVGLRQAEDAVRDAIIESVENGWLTPPQGVDLIARVTESVYSTSSGATSLIDLKTPIRT